MGLPSEHAVWYVAGGVAQGWEACGAVTHRVEEAPPKHRVRLCDDLGEPPAGPAARLLRLQEGCELIKAATHE